MITRCVTCGQAVVPAVTTAQLSRWARTVAVLSLGLAIGACSDSATKPKLSTCATEGPLVQIVDNHLPSGGDHKLVVTPAEVAAATEKTYDIRGDNVGHTHFVTLSTSDFLNLQAGGPLTVLSSNNGTVGIGHDHTINLTCP